MSKPSECSLYPLHPPGTKRLIRVSPDDLTVLDRLIVASSSLFIVGSIAWTPVLCLHWYRQWKIIPKEQMKHRAMYLSVVAAILAVFVAGPQRHARIGKWLQIRKWSLWNAWLRYIAMEVLVDTGDDRYGHSANISTNDQVMYAFVPHGIFPFAFALGALPELAKKAFGVFRPVVATAIHFFPIVRDLLHHVDPVDASRTSVDRAMERGERLGVIPKGIAEIFEGYPKVSTHPDEEYAIVRHGFLKLAQKHQVPVVPVYCFGATKLLRRLELPLVERLSLWFRVSICVFYGMFGLPIPFRQRILYVMGRPIVPSLEHSDISSVERMHREFCSELVRVFERHKEAYGWAHKTLKLVTR